MSKNSLAWKNTKKEYEKKMKKEKGKYKEEVRKFIALKNSSSKSSKNEQSDHEERDNNNSGYRHECLMIKKDNEKWHHRKSRKSRRVYISSESSSDSSRDESSTSSVESAQICLMENGTKKKNVIPSKLELTSDLSYSQIQYAFDNLHREAFNIFKKLSSYEKIFLQLEAKVLESEKKLEAIKLFMLDVQKDKIEDEKPFRFGYESCHNWEEEIKVECLDSTEKMWYLDSGCSRHMKGDISLFIDFVPKKKGFTAYGDNNKGVILGKGSVGNSSSTIISDVMLVYGLKHNLLSIGQLCDKGFKVTFTNTCCLFEHNEKKDCIFKGLRVNNTYMRNLDVISLIGTKCLATISENNWLWHRLLAHINFDLLNKVTSKDLILLGYIFV
ncbi:uncharacterized protein LOC127082317 [Lathyrus oleraceus]|uniref:uncharacterized protein LOC127082317 n=1 Tax=Pisum sativum TaxID=3888 RepID=UPI0021D0ACBA|nr:uncharacterized protein LOC127082317 [Pisum sativum]